MHLHLKSRTFMLLRDNWMTNVEKAVSVLVFMQMKQN